MQKMYTVPCFRSYCSVATCYTSRRVTWSTYADAAYAAYAADVENVADAKDVADVANAKKIIKFVDQSFYWMNYIILYNKNEHESDHSNY